MMRSSLLIVGGIVRGASSIDRPGREALRWSGVAKAAALLLLLLGCAQAVRRPAITERVQVAPGGKGFQLASGQRFVPWGFNYDHDQNNRLIEEYWGAEWARVEKDFREMKRMGANISRIHLQLNRFLRGPDRTNEQTLAQLGRLLRLAEEVGIYLDLTGAASYRKGDVPAWYDGASEKERWAIQARFWEAVASRCANSPAVFCYNLMNEPLIPGGPGKEWLSGALGPFHFCENLTRDPGKRSRADVAKEWLGTLIPAVRKHDPRRMVTVGSFFVFDAPQGFTLAMSPRELADRLDYLSVHMYPREGKIDAQLKLLEYVSVGKPVMIEEMYPLHCSPESFQRFLEASRAHASGWIGFFWGETIEELKRKNDLPHAITAGWLEFFVREAPRFKG